MTLLKSKIFDMKQKFQQPRIFWGMGLTSDNLVRGFAPTWLQMMVRCIKRECTTLGPALRGLSLYVAAATQTPAPRTPLPHER